LDQIVRTNQDRNKVGLHFNSTGNLVVHDIGDSTASYGEVRVAQGRGSSAAVGHEASETVGPAAIHPFGLT
jgi:hypothetical protein